MDRSQIRSLTVLMALGTFVVVLDNTIMNVSIQALVSDLGTTVSGVQSAIALNALMMAAFVLFGGKLADILGMKTTFMAGVCTYIAGSLLASFSHILLVFIAGWCIIQGFGAALMLPNVQTILRAVLPSADRARAYGILSGVNALGAATGPIIGGFLTTYASWRWAFRLEVLVLLLLVLFRARIPADQAPDRSAGIDMRGTALQAGAMISTVLGILLVADYGFIFAKHPLEIAGHELSLLGLGLSPVIVLLAIGFLLSICFFRVEKNNAAQHRSVLLHFSIFKTKAFVDGLKVRAIQVSTIAGILFTIPLFMQVSFGTTAFATGVALLPLSVSLILGATLGVRWRTTWAPRSIVRAGAGVVMAGALILMLAVHQGTSPRDLTLGLSVYGFGAGLVGSQIVNMTLSAVAGAEIAEASGTTSTVEQLGNSVGVAILGTVFTVALSLGLSQQLKGNTTLPTPIKEQAQTIVERGVSVVSDQQITEAVKTLDPAQANEILLMYDSARTNAFRISMLVVAAMGLLMFVLSTSLPLREPLEVSEQP